ncbi:BRO family protein [Mammaliicoccus sciuri]|uniref:BRO family protein n=1 Tax=Mammaliicoccus sciuri TaxID=1296 RepID=UPI0034DD403A
MENLEVLTIEGKQWFPAIKIAEILGYSNPRDAINRHTKQRGVVNHRRHRFIR